MKKVLIIFLIICCFGCNSNISKEKELYDIYVDELQNNFHITKELPCDIKINLDFLNDTEYFYQVVLDLPKEHMKNIKVLVTHNIKTEDIYPSSGIFEEPLSLIPNEIDKASGKVKGIILSGYIPITKEKKNIRVLIDYDSIDNIKQKVFYEEQF